MYYKVLVVDDEKRIRDGLKTLVHWNEIGFELIGEACNGMEAMNFIKDDEYPQAILTDIRMPVMDGLALMEEVKRKGIHIEFIILSGYDYFEYAKKAIEFGAFDYILKPTKLDELKTKFIRLKEKLDKEKKKDLVLDKGLTAIRDNCVKDMIYHNYTDICEIMDKMMQAEFFIGNAGIIVAVVNVTNNGNTCCDDKITGDIKRLVEHWFRSFSTVDEFHNAVYFFLSDKEEGRILSDGRISELAAEIINFVEDEGMQCSIGISNITRGVENICTAYKQAVEALGKKFFRGLNRCIKYSGCAMQTANIEYPLNYEKKLLMFIEQGDKRNASMTVDELFENVLLNECLDTAHVYRVCMEMILTFARCYKNVSQQIEEVFDENKMVYKKLLEFGTLDLLKKWFNERTLMVIDLILDFKEDNGSRIASHIKRIIEKRYHDQITLALLADELYMNPDYLSRLFKKETGISFIDYLTAHRIEKAKEFLRDVSCKSYEVGFRVGYKDASYFSKTFKRITGMSVNVFREGLQPDTNL